MYIFIHKIIECRIIYMCMCVYADADMEDYGFEYSDEEPEEQDVDIENQYYNSKGLVETDPEGALSGFDEVVRMEPEKAEWGFKALKQTVKLYYRLGRYKEMMDAYRVMLTYIKSAVTRNYSEKCINNIMDFVSGSASQNFGLLQEFYQTTLKALEEAKNERLWFKTNLKLCKIWFDMGEYGRMNKILKELHKSCQKEDGTDDQKKGSQLLEVYAIEIQMYTETKNNKKLKQLYQKALAIKSAIPHPRIMGIIRECGGKMHMAERQWADAATDFFEAFKNYDEAGNQRRIQCLKYLVLANMLMESEVNPFDGQEAKPYKNDPEILAMTNLIAAYQRNEILEFEKILKSNRRTIMDDPFIRNYIEDLLKNVRTQVLLKLIKPYTRIRIPFISKELNVPEKDVEQLLVSLILDNRIDGHIDQVNRLLERGDRSKGMKKYAAIDKWNTQLKSLYQTISNRRIQVSSKQVLAIARYSAFADDLEALACFLDFHEARAFPRKTQYPITDIFDAEAFEKECFEMFHFLKIIPCENLFESIEGLVESTYSVLPLLAKTRRRFHVYHFMQIAMKKGILNVQLMDEPVASSSNSQQIAEGSEFGCRRKGFLAVNALNLSVSFSNKASFVAFNGAIRLVFDFVNPFAANQFMTNG
ncbi:unnamed protein product [Prunus brigantina]